MIRPLSSGIGPGTTLPAVSSGKTYAQLILSANPIAYLRLGDSSGTTAADATGNGNNGAYSGAYTLAQTGIISGAGASVLFGGGQIDIPYNAAFDLPSTGAIEAWSKTSDASANQGIFDKTIGGGTNSGPMLFLQAGNLTFRLITSGFALWDLTWPATTGVTYALATWSQSGGFITMTLYVNGSSVASRSDVTGAVLAFAGSILIGHLGSSVYPFGGYLQEIALYGYDPGSAVALAHYTRGSI